MLRRFVPCCENIGVCIYFYTTGILHSRKQILTMMFLVGRKFRVQLNSCDFSHDVKQ